MTWYRRIGKRIVDVTVAIPGIVVLAPVALIVAALVRVKLGHPVFFRQERPGRGGETFELIKFRTMTDERDSDGRPLPDSQRLTPFGARLRSSSLDELPTLLNVVRGDMSLVGPRPLLVRYLDRYTPAQRRRHEVQPGITGWAQIHGRNAISWEQRFLLDLWYVEHISLRTDLAIIFRTLGQIVRQRDVTHGGHVTMPEFEPEAKEGGDE